MQVNFLTHVTNSSKNYKMPSKLSPYMVNIRYLYYSHFRQRLQDFVNIQLCNIVPKQKQMKEYSSEWTKYMRYNIILWSLWLFLGQRVLMFSHHYYRWKYCSVRSEEHTSELQSRETISYAVFCLKKKKKQKNAV